MRAVQRKAAGAAQRRDYDSSAAWRSAGQATEIEIAAKHILRTKQKLNTILAENCGQPYDVIAADTERDNWKSAEEAMQYGLIDKVITDRADVADDK